MLKTREILDKWWNKPKKPRIPILHKLAVSAEKSNILKKIRHIDIYGLHGGPRGRGRTIVGGIISVIFIIAIIVLNVINIVQLVQGQRSLTSSHSIFMNPRENVPFKVYGIFSKEGTGMGFPVLDLFIDNRIDFFEEEKPSIQKILVMDNTFYNAYFATNFSDPPITKSVYSQVSVPFNSVALKLPGAQPPVMLNVNQMILAQLPSQFSQDVQTQELIKIYKSLTNYTFYPHDISVYLRFKSSQLQQLLDNQLDVAIYNYGEWKNSKNPAVFYNLSTLITDSTLHSITKMNKTINTLVLRAHLNYSTSNDSDSVNWNIGIQYSPNFNYTLGDYFCYNETSNNISKTNFGVQAWVIAPRDGSYTLELVDSANLWQPPSTPFSMMIMNQYITEKVIITNITGRTLHLKSSVKNDFEVLSINCEEYADTLWHDAYKLLRPPASLPQTIFSYTYWRYYDRDTWFRLPVCECFENTPNLYCSLCQDAQSSELEFKEVICAVNRTNQTTLLPNLAIVAMSCNDGEPKMLTDTVVSGSFGLLDPHSTPCPDDVYYNGKPVIDFSDATTWCSKKPSARLLMKEGKFEVFTQLSSLVDDFSGNLKIGAFDYPVNVSATYPTSDWVNIIGLPPYEECGTSQLSIPASAIGQLVLPVNPGDMFIVIDFDLEEGPSYLPTVGPYAMLIETFNRTIQDYVHWDVNISNAFCPKDNIQTIVLKEPLAPDLIENIQSNFYVTTTVEFAFAGDDLIKFWDDEEFVNQLCNLEEIFIKIGSNKNYVYRDSLFELFDDQDQNCCDVDTCEGLITLQILGYLPENLRQGTEVFLRTDTTPYLTNTPILTAIPTSEENKLSYQAQKRYRSFPVPNLDIDVAAFVVPQKREFDEFTQLCVNKRNDSVRSDSDWSIARSASLDRCEISHIASICEETRCEDAIMSPTTVFTFSQNIPVNHKWVRTEGDMLNSMDSPEYLIDTSSVYYFDYTENDLKTGNQFSATTVEQGDYDQHTNLLEFSGEMDFIGKSSSKDPKFSLYPANAPALDFTVTLSANKTATNQIVKSYGKATAGLYNAIGWDLQVVDKFQDITLRWPAVLPITLQPGFNYTFKAIISLQPIYDVGILGGSTLRDWNVSTDTSFERTRTLAANCANVRLQVNFMRDIPTLENRVIYNFFDYIAGVGSSIALLSIGLLFLAIWQILTLDPKVLQLELAGNDVNPYTADPSELPRSRAESRGGLMKPLPATLSLSSPSSPSSSSSFSYGNGNDV